MTVFPRQDIRQTEEAHQRGSNQYKKYVRGTQTASQLDSYPPSSVVHPQKLRPQAAQQGHDVYARHRLSAGTNVKRLATERGFDSVLICGWG